MPLLQIVFTKDENSNYEHSLAKEIVTLGRLPSNDIVLPYPGVSRHHAEIRKTSEGYILQDLGSSNGTLVNGSKINRWLLDHNDQIQIGAEVTLTFLSPLADNIPSSFEIDGEAHEITALIDFSEFQQDLPSLLPPTKQTIQSGEADLLLEKNNKILYILYQFSQQLHCTSDFDELLKTIMDLIFEVIEADFGYIGTLGEQPGEILPKVIKHRGSQTITSETIQMSSSIFKQVIEQKSSILISNVKNDLEEAKSLLDQNIKSILSVPLWKQDQVIGLIQLNSSNVANLFTKKDLELLHTISNHISMLIEQANLTERVRLAESLEEALSEVQEQKAQLEERHQQLQETKAQLEERHQQLQEAQARLAQSEKKVEPRNVGRRNRS